MQMQTIIEHMDFFYKNYDVLKTPHFGINDPKIMLGDKNQPCRFCGKKGPDVKFKTVAHAIPESLGNKSVILLNECDSCNKFFSENLENHFDHYTKIYRTIGQIKGKKKVPDYKSSNHQTKIIHENLKIPLILFDINSNEVSFKKDTSEIEIIYDIEPYIPAAVYKCLVKMALSIMPERELDNFKDTIQWILCPDHGWHFIKPLILQSAFIPGPKPIDELYFTILKKKNLIVNYPSYIFFIAFGNVAYQIMVPSNLDRSFSSISCVPMFPPIPFEDKNYGSPEFIRKDMTSHEKQKDKIPITFTYEAHIEL